MKANVSMKRVYNDGIEAIQGNIMNLKNDLIETITSIVCKTPNKRVILKVDDPLNDYPTTLLYDDDHTATEYFMTGAHYNEKYKKLDIGLVSYNDLMDGEIGEFRELLYDLESVNVEDLYFFAKKILEYAEIPE